MAAVAVSGVLAAVAAVVLSISTPSVNPTTGLYETLFVLVGVVAGGIDRLALGDARRLRDRLRDLVRRRRAALVRGDAVHVERLHAVGDLPGRDRRPAPAAGRAVRARAARDRWSGYEARRAGWSELLGPVALVALLALALGALRLAADQVKYLTAIVYVAIVAALYVFVGNSGVISFGQVSFVAVGAFAAGRDDDPDRRRSRACCRRSSRCCATTRSRTPGRSCSPPALGGVYAFVVGIPLMRLSGIAAGIATLAVLGITYNLFYNWNSIGPGATVESLIPVTTDYWQATIGAVAVIVHRVRLPAQPLGRQLRAAREDPGRRAGGRHRHPPAAPARVHALGRALRLRRRPLRPPARQHRGEPGVPRPDLPDPGDARRRRDLEPVRRGRRRDHDQPVQHPARQRRDRIHVFGWGITAPSGTSLVGIAIVMLVILLLRPGRDHRRQGVLLRSPRVAGAVR